MKYYIVHRITPLTKKQLMRDFYSNCNHVPIFCCSWFWLAKFMCWLLQANFISYEQVDTEPCNDDSVDAQYTLKGDIERFNIC